MKKKYNLVYKTTNLTNGKIYIGVHSTNNLNDGYIGSGVRSKSSEVRLNKIKTMSAFHKAIVENGYENFSREILFLFDNPEDAYKKEKEIVTRDFVKLDSNYNSVVGGSGYIHKGTYKIKPPKRKADEINNGQFQNRTKEQRMLAQEKVNATISKMDNHFNVGLIRTDEQIINNSRSRSRFIYIDANKREFLTAFEAGKQNNISHKVAELRSRRGNLGWSRRLK